MSKDSVPSPATQKFKSMDMNMKLTRIRLTIASAVFVIATTFGATAFAGNLEEVTPATYNQKVMQSDKPVAILLTGPSCQCADAENALSAQVAKHPEFKFVKADGSGFRQSTAPGFIVYYPKFHQSFYRSDKFDPKDVDAFMDARGKFAHELDEVNAAYKQADDEAWNLVYAHSQNQERIDALGAESQRLRAHYEELVATERLAGQNQ